MSCKCRILASAAFCISAEIVCSSSLRLLYLGFNPATLSFDVCFTPFGFKWRDHEEHRLIIANSLSQSQVSSLNMMPLLRLGQSSV